MRIAVTVAMDSKGKWECLSTPETPIQEQKDALKALKVKGTSKFVKAVLLASSGPGKRYKFKQKAKSSAKTLADVKA